MLNDINVQVAQLNKLCFESGFLFKINTIGDRLIYDITHPLEGKLLVTLEEARPVEVNSVHGKKKFNDFNDACNTIFSVN